MPQRMTSTNGGDAAATNDAPGLARRLAIAATSLATVGLAAALLVCWIPIWPCPLFEHFRVQFVAAGLIALGATAALRMRGYLDAAAIATLVHGLAIAPDLVATPAALPAGGAQLRVLVLNVHTQSSSFDQVRRLIADENPDLLGLVEVDRRWLDAIAPALAGYPARIEHPRDDNFGVALYARGRGQLAGAAELIGSELPTIVADVAIDTAHLRVLLTHPLPPVSPAALEEQLDQFDAIAGRVRPSALPVLVMGDFNATPWSRPFIRLMRRTWLCDSRAGFGIQASFPAKSAVLRLPIDHLLASCNVGVRDRRIGRDIGSDHLPVIIDLAVPPSPSS
jgi:endonuclease/exonuclease/phosphatase (EEP) superfamily protein YafD